MKFDAEFKEALSHLPEKQKDKLLLRLLKKDPNLAQRLHFELLSTESIEDERQAMIQRIQTRAKDFDSNFYSVGYLMMDVRYLSGEITQHVRITKDKFGDAYLNLLMLVEVLKHNNENILSATPGKARKFCTAVIARIFKILIALTKMHPDTCLDFKENLENLAQLMSRNPYLMKAAIHNGLDLNWLVDMQIPEDIVDIHKDLRQRGYLK